jgi:hypothetical protein
MITLYRRPPIDVSYQVSVHLAKRLQRKRMLIISQSETRVSFLWWPCLLTTDWDEMRNLYRGPSIDPSYQVSVHLAKRFQRRRFFKNLPIRNKNCLWWPCLLMDWDEMSNLYRGPSIDASYQVSVHLAEGFQRRRLKCEKLTDRRRTRSDGKNSHCLWQDEVKKIEIHVYIYYKCSFFLF